MRASFTRACSALLLAIVLGAVAPATAFAGSTSSGTSLQGTKSTLTLKQYRAEVKLINADYAAAVAEAKAALAEALANATSPGERSTARAQYRLAVVVATTNRDTALVQLGNPPTGRTALTIQ